MIDLWQIFALGYICVGIVLGYGITYLYYNRHNTIFSKKTEEKK